jgi:hypothetical protein
MYGIQPNYNKERWRGMKDRQRQRPRPREASTHKPVAGLLIQKKEGQE